MTIVPSLRRRLQGPANRVDTKDMNHPEETQPPSETGCLAVLNCYAVRAASARSVHPDNSGWLDRIVEMPGLEPSQLTTIHGYLIAQGLIRFEFTGRSIGLQYQLSLMGRDCVSRGSLNLSDESRHGDTLADAIADSTSQAA